ncbi:hypothetical protein Baya_12112 [Bagarius yarrelli]|uniref:Uncharacterized protein n=1 Tax=Bagarius yarrelli TaxID=175774 RepID=A0A556V344_BAGYA|nr:hypothetical protein Baya_12112 [Bagarius yarrelli]
MVDGSDADEKTKLCIVKERVLMFASSIRSTAKTPKGAKRDEKLANVPLPPLYRRRQLGSASVIEGIQAAHKKCSWMAKQSKPDPEEQESFLAGL